MRLPFNAAFAHRGLFCQRRKFLIRENYIRKQSFADCFLGIYADVQAMKISSGRLWRPCTKGSECLFRNNIRIISSIDDEMAVRIKRALSEIRGVRIFFVHHNVQKTCRRHVFSYRHYAAKMCRGMFSLYLNAKETVVGRLVYSFSDLSLSQYSKRGWYRPVPGCM